MNNLLWSILVFNFWERDLNVKISLLLKESWWFTLLLVFIVVVVFFLLWEIISWNQSFHHVSFYGVAQVKSFNSTLNDVPIRWKLVVETGAQYDSNKIFVPAGCHNVVINPFKCLWIDVWPVIFHIIDNDWLKLSRRPFCIYF